MNKRRFFLAVLLLGLCAIFTRAVAAPREAVRIPIEGTIDEGMAHMVQRAVVDAQETHAAAIVLDVNTPGGLVSAATEIRDAVAGSSVPTVAFVSHRAWSAGALVTLSARRIVMAPDASIGAAQPIPNTVKTVSALRAEFEATAARRGRNRTLAAAMVDSGVSVPAYKRDGAILTLTADRAKAAGVADGIAATIDEALAQSGISGVRLRDASYTLAEKVARFATDPEVSGILLSIGMLGLLIEMQTLHGIAGFIGVSAFALFFGTHIYAGFSDSFVIVLAVLGVFGILFELHVFPGHGLAGGLGLVSLLAAIVLAFGIASYYVALSALALAIALTAIVFWIVARWFPENAFLRRIVFRGAQGGEYVASLDHSALLGRTGVAQSFLRPAGVGLFGSDRVDVLTEGDFVPAGAAIRVCRVEGARIFVRPLDTQ